MSAPAKAPRRRLSSELRQEEIVKAALELATRHGARGTTTHDIAAAMNLTQGAVFRHFPNKDAIWLAVIDWVRAQVRETLTAIETVYPDPLEQLQALYLAHAGFVARHASVPRLIFAELSQSENDAIRSAVRSLMGGFEARLRALVLAAKERGSVRADVDEQAAATLFLGTLQGLALQYAVFGGERSVPEQARRLLPLLLGAIRSKPARAHTARTEHH